MVLPAILIVLLTIPLLETGRASRPPLVPNGPAPAVGAALASSCTGAGLTRQYPGVLVNEGGPSPGPSVSAQTVELYYAYLQIFRPSNGTPITSCVPTQWGATTDSAGAFNLTATIPKSGCTFRIGCWNYTGPFGPLRFALTNTSTLAGDYLSWTIQGGRVTLARVAALDRVSLTPGGFATVSVLAPTAIECAPLAGDGRASPAVLSFAWSFSGTGWRVLSLLNGSSLTVEASIGAPIATARVWVNGTYNGTALKAPAVSVTLTAAATVIVSAGVVPTSVDVGSVATFSFTGSGAGGYEYNGTVLPGLGMASVSAPCAATPGSGGLVGLACTISLTYLVRGIAQPSVNLSNGYSSAYLFLPPVTVSPHLSVVVAPDPIVAYPGMPLTIRVDAAPGTGTAPMGPACLDTGDGGLLCNRAGGPSWTFPYAYAQPGTFEATVSVADSGGSNETLLVPVSIPDRPTLFPLMVSPNVVPVGAEIDAATVIAGGAMPLVYWWNVSAPLSTVRAGTLRSDGVVSLSVAATTVGPTTLTLTIVDALGTRVSSRVELVVTVATASAIVVVGPPNVTASAGVPVAFTFEALDRFGDRVPGYSGAVALSIEGTGSAVVWVNSSTLGPVPIGSDGSYHPNATGWHYGFLNVTVAESLSGPIAVALATGFDVTGPPPIIMAVGPDSHHLELLAPRVVRPGARTNATLYVLADRFGNPVPSGAVFVRSVFDSVVTEVRSPAFVLGGVSYVWVNYTAYGNGGGIVSVLSAENVTLLRPIVVPAESPSGPWSPALLLGLGAGALALGVGVVLLRRRRSSEAPGSPTRDEQALVEEELKRLAEGRAHVLSRVPTDRAIDLDEIAGGWSGRPPDAAELAEWVGSLVSEGFLSASVGPDGRPRFTRTDPPTHAPGPRIEIDPLALDAALARQRIEAERAEGDERGTEPGSDPEEEPR